MHKSADLRICAFDFPASLGIDVRYNDGAMKKSFAAALLLTALIPSGWKKSSNDAAVPTKTGDAVQQKLQEIAGNGATDCGRLKSQEAADVQAASQCAMNAAQNKHAFYVAYDLPGLTTAVAGDAQGKLFAIQSQTGESGAGVESTLCPSELRVAQSGRVTCYAPGSMNGMPAGAGANPHGSMPPATGANPHEGLAAPSHKSPHGNSPEKPH
jgi:hypothetical protein